MLGNALNAADAHVADSKFAEYHLGRLDRGGATPQSEPSDRLPQDAAPLATGSGCMRHC